MCNSIFWVGDQVYISSDIVVKRKKIKKNGDSCMLCLETFSSTQVFRDLKTIKNYKKYSGKPKIVAAKIVAVIERIQN